MKKNDTIDVRGFLSVSCEPRTIGDVREFLKLLDSYYLSDETQIHGGHLFVRREGEVSPIQCGCSVPDKPREFYVDALVTMHNCQE